MKKTLFEGSGVAIITPMKNNKIDYESYERILEFHLKNHTDALIVCGTTGEGATLNEKEKINIIELCKQRIQNRIPIILGAGSNNTFESVEFIKKIEKYDLEGLLVITPYYNKTSEEGIYAHFKTIAKSTYLPIVMYNVPGRTSVNMSVNLIKKLYDDFDNIVAIKEASGNISSTLKIKSICDIDVYSGNDDIILPMMASGAKGVISVLANAYPREVHELTTLCLESNFKKALNMQTLFSKMNELLFIEPNPIPIKSLMEILGFCQKECRLPLIDTSEELYDKLKKEVDNINERLQQK